MQIDYIYEQPPQEMLDTLLPRNVEVQIYGALLESIGKVPVLCKPAPGFIVPRLQSLVMNEAARMVEDGVATAEAIDRAVRYGFGFRYAKFWCNICCMYTKSSVPFKCVIAQIISVVLFNQY